MNLQHNHIMTLKLDVAPQKAHQIGNMESGRRLIVPITGGTFEGEPLIGQTLKSQLLKGTVEPGGHDWAFFQPDGIMKIDVRLVLRTDQDELIYLQYRGRLIAEPQVHQRMAAGEQVAPEEFSLTTIVDFETAAENLKWLNSTIAVGVGRQSGYQPTYEIYKIGN